MAKLFELSEENFNLIDEMFQQTGMHNYIDLKILGTSKSKPDEIVKVAKISPIAEYVGKCPDSVSCVVYEEAFDRLDEDTKKLIIEDAFAQIAYDSEKDKIVMGCPMIKMSIGGRTKYGEKLGNALELAATMVIEIEEEKKAAKEAEKASKNKKNS